MRSLVPTNSEIFLKFLPQFSYAQLNFVISSSVHANLFAEFLFLFCLLSSAFLSRFFTVFTIATVGGSSYIFCSGSSSSATIICFSSSSWATIIRPSSSFSRSLLLYYAPISCSPSSSYYYGSSSTCIFCIHGSTLTILGSTVIGLTFLILGP